MSRLIAILIPLLFIGCTPSETNFFYNEGLVFGTMYHFTYQSPRGIDYHDSIKARLKSFDFSLSTYNKASVISKINRNESVVVDSLFKHCFLRAQGVSEVTGGAFDITVAPLVNAWGFGFQKKSEITSHLIDSLLCLVGYETVALKDGVVVKENEKTMLTASAIAKGYGVDVVSEYLKSQGVKNFMVEIGGELRCGGVSSKNTRWRVGIDKPIDDPSVVNRELQEVVVISDLAMATSGNYRNFYLKDGKKYAHTIDPHTGYPVQHSLLSASVFAADCLTADAYATAFMVLGVEKSLEIVENSSFLEAYFIYDDGDGLKVVFTGKVEEWLLK